MARRKHNFRHRNSSRRSSYTPAANRRLSVPTFYRPALYVPPTFNPSPVRSLSFNRSRFVRFSDAQTVQQSTNYRRRFLTPVVSLREVSKLPLTTRTCLRRSVRKEVLHALGRAGAGHRPPRYNETSNIRCK